MAQKNITYEDKISSNPQPLILDKNKITGDDMTEIKDVVNDNATDAQSQLDSKVNAVITQNTLINPIIFDKSNDFNIPISTDTVLEVASSGNSTGITYSMYRFKVELGVVLSFGNSFPSELLQDSSFINSILSDKTNTVTLIWDGEMIRRWSNQTTARDIGYSPELSLSNIEYWDFSESVDSTLFTTTGKKGNVLTSDGYDKPTLIGDDVDFNGTTQALKLNDTSLFDYIEPTNREGQFHFVGESTLPSGNRSLFRLYDKNASGGSYFNLVRVNSQTWLAMKTDAGAADNFVYSSTISEKKLYSVSYSGGLYSLYINGVLVLADSPIDPLGALNLNSLELGNVSSNNSFITGYISDLVFGSDPTEDFNNNMSFLIAKNGL